MITWMMYALAVSTLLGLAALLAERGARRAGVPGRWMWVAAIGLTIALPVLAQWRPSERELEKRPAAAAAIETTTLDPVLLVSRDPSLVDRVVAWARDLEPTLNRAAGYARALGESAVANRIAILLWTLASLAVLGAVIVAALRLAAGRREWSLALLDDQFVRVSENVGPAVVGLLHGEIVVPAWALELPPERREMLLVHEREHLRARDPLLLLTALAALVMMPWNVALWWQVRRLRLAVEMDCDGRVLRHVGDVRAYGALLIEVGRRSARAPLAAAAFSEPATHLERRIHMMLARTPRWRVLRATALTAAGLGLVIVACDMQPPTSVSPENEVALATLGANGKSWNVKQGTVAADVRAAIEGLHPELLTDQSGQRWVVQLTLDREGRVIGTGKVHEQSSDVSRMRELVPPWGRPSRGSARPGTGELIALTRPPVLYRIPAPAESAEDWIEVGGRGDTLARALRGSREREVVAAMARADTGRLRASYVELAPTASSARMTEEAAARRLAPTIRMRDSTSRRIVVRGNLISGRPRVPQMSGLEKIDADRIESVEIIKGGAIDGLAPAVSGVIVIRLKY